MGISSALTIGMGNAFTVDQANKMLPLISRIVEDAVREYYRWQDRVREFELAAVRSTVDHPDTIAIELEADVLRLAENVDSYLHELRQLGVELTSIQKGIVTFPAEADEQQVSLTWQLGDELVQQSQYTLQNG